MGFDGGSTTAFYVNDGAGTYSKEMTISSTLDDVFFSDVRAELADDLRLLHTFLEQDISA